MPDNPQVAEIDWRASLTALFDDGTMDFMGRHFGRGFPMDADRNLMSWSDWLIQKIESRRIPDLPRVTTEVQNEAEK